MHKLRARLKRLIAYSLYYTGTLWIYAAFKLKGRAVALTYHRVLPEEADSFSTRGIVVSPASFELQMDFLHRHFTILSADQFHACLARGAFPRRACLITFDDGWSDNDRFALPILERLGIPAVLFIATGYVGTGTVFWQEELTRWLYAASRSSTKATELLDELGIGAACGVTDTEARRIVRDFVTGMKSTEPTEVTRIRDRIRTFARSNNADTETFGDDAFLTWDAVRHLAATGLFSVASHAHSHEPLTRLDRANATADLLRSKYEIQRNGLPVLSMCSYPNGDHNATVMNATRDAGFSTAFTTVPGHVAIGNNWLRLPRINVHDSAGSSRPEFLCRLLGLF